MAGRCSYLQVEVNTLVAQIGGGALGAQSAGESSCQKADRPGAVPSDAAPAEDPNSDAGIIAHCLEHGGDRFKELVARYSQMIAVFAFSRLGSRDAAEEVAQQTMVTAYEQLPRLRAHRSFSNWLLAIANSIVVRALKDRMRSVSLDGATRDGQQAAALHPKSPAEEPADRLGQTELWQRILTEIDALPPRYSTIVALKHQTGMSCKEIAANLGLPMGTVTGRLSRAYQMIRERVGEDAL